MVYLAYEGLQNMFLTESPEFTHFRTVYTRDSPSINQNFEIPFDQNLPLPGDTLISTLPQKGDYITGVSLKLILQSITPPSDVWNWQETSSPAGFIYGYSSTDTLLFIVSLNGTAPVTNLTNWYTKSTEDLTITATSDNKFQFTYSSDSVGYIVFSDKLTAQLFGFVSEYVNLFGGYVRINISPASATFSSQVTFQECGWLKGPVAYTSGKSYIDDICYKFINSASLYIGKQLIQQFDGTYIKITKQLNGSYKNLPVLKLLEGNTNTVDFNRVYYMKIPFIQIPFHALGRQDVQVRVDTNPFEAFNFYASLIVDYSVFPEGQLPRVYTIPITQVSFFNRTTKLDVKGPLKQIFSAEPSDDFVLKFNGEVFCDSDYSNVSSFENHFNISPIAKTVVFNNPINMSRIRDQEFITSSNVQVYTESINILQISNDLCGIMYGQYELSNFPRLTGNVFVNS